jgi:hypothetical protein
MQTTLPPPPNLTVISRALAEACVQIPISQGPDGIARELARIAPELTFRQVLSRGGWYRLGGVVDAAGQHVAESLEDWAQDELAANEQDLASVAAAHEGENLRATRVTGKTHYWVAGVGKGAADFIQIEIEELQEVICHVLFPDDQAPASIEDLVDPRGACSGQQSALGTPFYTLRRVTDIGDFLRAMAKQKPEPQAIHRFVDAWEGSSAGRATELSHHWVIAVREHLDQYKQTIRSASPVAALNGAAPRFESGFGTRGVALAEALHRFDRQAGYPMAWFFHMLITKAVPHAVASVVIEDQQTGFSYLPERDLQLVRDWLHRPYGF